MKRAAGLIIFFLSVIPLNITAQSLSGLNITGTPNIGSSLTGNYTGDLGATGDHYKYEWRYSPARTLLSSTTTSYTIQAADNAKQIYFIVYILDASNGVLVKDSSAAVLVNSKPVVSSLSIVGDPRPGLTIWATYSFYDADGNTESGSAYQWYTDTDADGIGAEPILVGATSKSYKVKDGDAGNYLGFSVTPGASPGSTPGATVTIGTYLAVTANDPPQVQGTVTITGGLNVNDVLTGHYTYYDYEGDLESGSSYEWSTSTTSGGTYTPISEAGISHKIAMLEQGLFFKLKVVPHAATGSNSSTGYTSSAKGPANSKPYVTGVAVSGTAAVGQTLTASYTFSDPDAGDNIDESIKQWYRGNQLISGAGYPDYTLISEDVDSLITFKVTPVSGGPGYPDTGDPVSVSRGPATDPLSGVPIAKNLCICGYRAVDSVLSGNYTYQNSYSEKNSIYRWYRGDDVVREGNSSSFRNYTVKAADMASTIRFAVIPRNRLGTTGTLVFSDSLAFFDMPRVIFSVSDNLQELKARPVGGSFSGTGVSNGMFNPATGVGIYKVKYVLPINKPSATCAQITTQALEVKPLTISFSGIRPRYCDGDGPDLITVHKVPLAPNESKFTINDTISSCLVKVTDSTALFYPDKLRSGNKIDRIIYTYTKINIFPLSVQHETIDRQLVVDHIGKVDIINPKPGAEFCSDVETVFITTDPSGGTFTGPVTDGKLDPALMPRGYGDTTIVYRYTSTLGCSKTVSVPVTINALPKINFVPSDTCILDDTDATIMDNMSAWVAGLDSIASWDWKFYDNNINYPRTGFEPSYLYKKGGTHQITLTATTTKGCSKTRVKTFNFCRKPTAGFTWLNECFTPGGYIQFFDKTDSTSALLSRRWIFNNLVTVNNQYQPRYPHTAPGYLPVKYLVTTGFPGCDDSISKDVYIRPKITVPRDGILEEFKKGNGGWVKDYESRNSWIFGKPGRTVIRSAHSGDTAWYTGFDIDTQAVESSSVISPCYDFTAIARPMISMWLYKRFDRNRDGAALQYKTGDLGTWEYVGSLEDGIRWFNSADIKGRPGGDLVGWTSLTSQDTKWSESRHKIDKLAGKTDVRFRIAYGSDGLAAENDGVAFDDIWIGERTRSVLLEHFSNTSSVRSSEVTDVINTITENYRKDVINIQYHTNFPGSDPYYSENPGDASARILYYGLIKSPYSFIDGGYNRDMFATISDYNLSDIDSLNVNRRSLINPDFNITINSVITGGVLTTGGQIRAIENLNADNLTLYLAVTEKQNNNHTGALGETAFYNVFRKFIPDAGGINLKKTWTKGETFTMAGQSWVINNIKSNADIEVIAFLQNNVTKEIYQAASKIETNITVGIENINGREGNGFAIFPNPVVNKITLAFREQLSRDADIMIYDLKGVIVKTWKAESGIIEFTVDDTGLAEGIYLIRVSSGGIDLGFRKLVVEGK